MASLYLIDTGDDYVESSRRPPDDEWVTPSTAADILCASKALVADSFRPTNNYHEVRRILRGSAGKSSARGQGHLFNANDLRRIAEIRKIIGCQITMAAMIFAAQQLGEL